MWIRYVDLLRYDCPLGEALADTPPPPPHPDTSCSFHFVFLHLKPKTDLFSGIHRCVKGGPRVSASHGLLTGTRVN